MNQAAALKQFATSRTGMIGAAAAVSAVAVATWVEYRARRAERKNPPLGKFVDVDGVRLHYVERGEGPPVVLIHGNTVQLQDFMVSGLVGRLASNHRVIAFDRHGFGHSERPRDRLWTPFAQAQALGAALSKLGIDRAAVVGHSMGTMVALALALDRPAQVSSLTLLGGYYYPKARIDALMMAPVALPVIGDVMRYTVTALSGRALIGSSVKAMFAPNGVPADFFPMMSREMMLRPSQLRANAEDASFMMSAAQSLRERYGELRMPVTIIAGEEDAIVDIEAHSERLHQDLPLSELVVVAGTGHMAHYAAHESVAVAVARGRSAVD